MSGKRIRRLRNMAAHESPPVSAASPDPGNSLRGNGLFGRILRPKSKTPKSTGGEETWGLENFGSPRHTKYVQGCWRVGGRAISPLLTKGLCEVLPRSRPDTPCRHQTGSKGKVQQGIGKLGKRGGRGAPQLEIWRAALAARGIMAWEESSTVQTSVP